MHSSAQSIAVLEGMNTVSVFVVIIANKTVAIHRINVSDVLYDVFCRKVVSPAVEKRFLKRRISMRLCRDFSNASHRQGTDLSLIRFRDSHRTSSLGANRSCMKARDRYSIA